jgi:hypothetical protein
MLLGHSELRVTMDFYAHLQKQTAARAAQQWMRSSVRGSNGVNGPVTHLPYSVFLRKDGAGTRTRTEDLLITNQLLYQLSYAGQARDVRSENADSWLTERGLMSN